MLEIAEAWGVPPWEVEARASLEWIDRFKEWASAKHERQEDSMKDAKRQSANQGGRRVRRLI